MAKTLTLRVVNGRDIGTATLGDDGQLSYSTDVVEQVMRGWVDKLGAEKGFEFYADWSNGYLQSQQIDPAPAAEDEATVAEDEATVAAGSPQRLVERWRGTIAPFGLMSGDRRVFRFAEGAWSNRDLPRPVSYQRADAPGHDGAVTVGRITSLKITKNGFEGDGDWIDEMPETSEAKGLLRNGVLYPSVDLDEYEFQYETEDGRLLDGMSDDEFEEWFMSGEEPVMAFTAGRVGKVTFLAFEAFPQTTLELYEGAATVQPVTAHGAGHGTVDFDEPCADEDSDECREAKQAAAEAIAEAEQIAEAATDDAEPVVAAGKPAGIGPTYPPERWFGDPELTELTPITVVDDGPDRGRVFGHLSDRDCHMSFLNQGQCVLPPDEGGFEWFHRGEVKTAEGTFVAVGLVSAGTGHADLRRSAAEAAAHYDQTGRQVAMIRAGRDKFGTWVAGSIVPEASEQQVQMLRRSPLSGDWRVVGGKRELVHALCVNMPGYPTIRGRVSHGRAVSLVSSGWEGWSAGRAADRPPTRRLEAAVERVVQRERARARIDAAAEVVAASIGRDRASLIGALDREVHGGS